MFFLRRSTSSQKGCRGEATKALSPTCSAVAESASGATFPTSDARFAVVPARCATATSRCSHHQRHDGGDSLEVLWRLKFSWLPAWSAASFNRAPCAGPAVRASAASAGRRAMALLRKPALNHLHRKRALPADFKLSAGNTGVMRLRRTNLAMRTLPCKSEPAPLLRLPQLIFRNVCLRRNAVLHQ